MKLDEALHVSRDLTVRRSWKGRLFLLFSALAHIAAAAALSNTWPKSSPESTVRTMTPAPRPERPQVARLAIDVAPVRFCEMKIEKIIGQAPRSVDTEQLHPTGQGLERKPTIKPDGTISTLGFLAPAVD